MPSGSTTGLVLDRLGRGQERDRDVRSKRTGQHARRHRRVEQAEIDQIGIDRVEPLPGLGQHLEAGAQAVDGRRSVAALPGIGAGEDLAGQGLWSIAPSCPIAMARSRSIQRAVPSARKSWATAIIPGSSEVSGVPTAPSRSWIWPISAARSVPDSSRIAPASSAWVR